MTRTRVLVSRFSETCRLVRGRSRIKCLSPPSCDAEPFFGQVPTEFLPYKEKGVVGRVK
ncbi:MAG: hypothetical protein IJD82_05545 [Clostridia bacterium]|nr:hypothetical protein [Clostridia bacterium]